MTVLVRSPEGHQLRFTFADTMFADNAARAAAITFGYHHGISMILGLRAGGARDGDELELQPMSSRWTGGI